jgi:tryptophan synthase alpha chain
MNGMDRISDTFKRCRQAGRAACMPYFTLGYPNATLSGEILLAAARSGADLFELGIPFSDPLADGPTIQHSTQTALENGMTVRGCLEQVRRLRQHGVEQPLLLMSYINPLLAFGMDRFASQAAAAGADGLIVPDLPPEESAGLEEACRRNELALVYLLAPTSTPERIALAASRASGFIYLVSVTGVTGARNELPPDLSDFIARVRRATDLPLAVGFGIATPQQAAQVGRLADGVIVGSALINAIDRSDDPCETTSAFIQDLAAALQPEPGLLEKES